jgi:sirohydrochlorin ferrochelatase
VIVALIDNGSLEPAAHSNLRAVATAISSQTGVPVHAVSWKHSHRIPASQLGGEPAPTLVAWMEAQLARGERQFLFVPFFISAQGAIGSALRSDLESLRAAGPSFEFSFTDGLAARGIIPEIVAARIRDCIVDQSLRAPAVIVVDHGGPSPLSAALRDQLAIQTRALLGAAVSALAAASMEGEDHPHNQPLLAAQLEVAPFNRGDVVIAPLFLSPGRHAGTDGDLAQITREAERNSAGALRCHFTLLIGEHPQSIATLAAALRESLTTTSVPFAV